MKQRLWHLRIETDELLVLTPWFYLWATHGALDVMRLALCWHIRLNWSRRQNPREGEMLFAKSWEWEFRPSVTVERAGWL